MDLVYFSPSPTESWEFTLRATAATCRSGLVHRGRCLSKKMMWVSVVVSES